MAKQREIGGVSASQFARMQNVHHSYVQKLIRQEKLHPLPSGKLDPVGAAAEMKLATNLLSLKGAGEGAGAAYRSALTARTLLQARKLQQELRLKDGELLPRRFVLEWATAMATELKLRLRSLPTRLAAQIAAESRPAKVQEKLLTAIDDVLTVVAARMERWNGEAVKAEQEAAAATPNWSAT